MKLAPLIILLAVSCFAQTTNCVPAPPGLVSWWRAEGNANDSAGTNNGMISGALTYLPGEVGQAFSFGAAHSDVTVPASQSLNVGTGAGLTIEAWVQPLQVPPGQPIFDWSPNDMFGAHFWVWSTGALYANLVDVLGNYHIIQSSDGLVIANAFQHIAVTYDKASGISRLFLNGTKVAELNLGTFTPLTSTDLQIGYRLPGAPFGESVFQGFIDEASLYNRALGTNEISEIYAAGSAGKCQPVAPYIVSQPQGQVGYWGGSVTFSVTALGTLPLGYLWYKDGLPIMWGTSSNLVLTNLSLDDGGSYSVVVSNALGSVTSSNALLTVNPAGVSLGIYPGVTVLGTPGKTFGIQYATNVSPNSTWLTLTQFTLMQPVQMWFDAEINIAIGSNPRRFYRVVAVP